MTATLYPGFEFWRETAISPLIYMSEKEEQAKLFDISFWARTGGVDWPRAAQYFDGVINRAGQGYYGYDRLLPEHMDKSEDVGLPAHAYWQIDPRESTIIQADKFLNGYKCEGKKKCIAWERTGGGLSTWPEVLAMASYISAADPAEVYIYSRINIMVEAGLNLDDVSQFKWFIAQYPYEDAYTRELYTRFESYLEDRPYEYPAGLRRYGVEEWAPHIMMHQFTSNLDARYYFANQYTEDPDWQVGLRSGDGVVSMLPYTAFMEWFVGESIPAPPIPPAICPNEERITWLEDQVEDLTLRVQALEAVEVEPPDSGELVVVITDKHKPHYFADTDDKGKPIMRTFDDINPFQVGQEYRCQVNLALHDLDDPDTPVTIASGGGLYYRIIEDGPYRGRFIREDKSRKL